jgi:hypothetical protein
LKCEVPEMAKSCILEICWQLYIYVYFTVSARSINSQLPFQFHSNYSHSKCFD